MTDHFESSGTCTICLNEFNNKSRSNACLHKFCFECLKKWSSVNSSCPLCRKSFEYIYHSFTDLGHETHTVQFNVNLSVASVGYRPRGRERIYIFNLWAEPLPDSNGQFMDCDATFLRANPQQLQRLKRFITRDVCVILRLINSNSLGNHENIIDTIMHLMVSHGIDHTCFRSTMLTFLHEYAIQFIHELYNFARSPYEFDQYEENVRYSRRFVETYTSESYEVPVLDSLTISSNDNDSDYDSSLTTRDIENSDMPRDQPSLQGSLYRSMNQRMETNVPRVRLPHFHGNNEPILPVHPNNSMHQTSSTILPNLPHHEHNISTYNIHNNTSRDQSSTSTSNRESLHMPNYRMRQMSHTLLRNLHNHGNNVTTHNIPNSNLSREQQSMFTGIRGSLDYYRSMNQRMERIRLLHYHRSNIPILPVYSNTFWLLQIFVNSNLPRHHGMLLSTTPINRMHQMPSTLLSNLSHRRNNISTHQPSFRMNQRFTTSSSILPNHRENNIPRMAAHTRGFRSLER